MFCLLEDKAPFYFLFFYTKYAFFFLTIPSTPILIYLDFPNKLVKLKQTEVFKNISIWEELIN